jgi:hypothetical protein
VENPLGYLRWPRVDPFAWCESQGRQGPTGQSRPSPAMVMWTKRIAFGAYQPRAFRIPWLRFSVIFLSFKVNARLYDTNWGHVPHSTHPPGSAASPKRLSNDFATQPVWVQTPDSQPSNVSPPSKLVLCHLGSKHWQDQSWSSAWLQNR